MKGSLADTATSVPRLSLFHHRHLVLDAQTPSQPSFSCLRHSLLHPAHSLPSYLPFCLNPFLLLFLSSSSLLFASALNSLTNPFSGLQLTLTPSPEKLNRDIQTLLFTSVLLYHECNAWVIFSPVCCYAQLLFSSVLPVAVLRPASLQCACCYS